MVRLADYVVSFLEHVGVKDIFTISGGGSIFLNDALGQSNIKYYCCISFDVLSIEHCFFPNLFFLCVF